MQNIFLKAPKYLEIRQQTLMTYGVKEEITEEVKNIFEVCNNKETIIKS